MKVNVPSHLRSLELEIRHLEHDLLTEDWRRCHRSVARMRAILASLRAGFPEDEDNGPQGPASGR